MKSFLSMAAAVWALAAVAEPYNRNTDWMSGRIGVFQHCLHKGRTPETLRGIARYDAPFVANQLAEIGADWFCFTLLQVWPYMNAPNDDYERLTGQARGSRCSAFDIPARLIRELEPRGIRLMLYAPGTPPRYDRAACLRLGFKMRDNPDADPLYTPEGAENWGKALGFWSRHYGKSVSGWWIDGCYDYGGFSEAKAGAAYARYLKSGNPAAVVAFNPGCGVHAHDPAEDFLCGEEPEPLIRQCRSRWHEGRQWHLLTYSYVSGGFPDLVRHTDGEWVDWARPILSAGGAVTIDAGCELPTGHIPARRARQLKNVFAALKGRASPEQEQRLACERRIRSVTDRIDGANLICLDLEKRTGQHLYFVGDKANCRPDETRLRKNAAGETIWSDAIQATLDARGTVFLPWRREPYRLDRPIVLASGQSLGGSYYYWKPLDEGHASILAPAKGYAGPLVSVANAKDVYVRGPVFADCTDPVRVTQTDGLVLREVAFRNCAGSGVVLSAVRNFRVDGVRVGKSSAMRCGVATDEACTLGLVRNVIVAGNNSGVPVDARGTSLLVEYNKTGERDL